MTEATFERSQPHADALRRGEEFRRGLGLLVSSLAGIDVSTRSSGETSLRDASIIVVPQFPVHKETLGFEFHSGEEKLSVCLSEEQFEIVRFSINLNGTSVLVFGETQQRDSELGYHHEFDRFIFDPTQHTIAIELAIES